MKFKHHEKCDCGGQFVFSAYGDANFGASTCSKCGKLTYLTDPLSVSVTAERLLYRSKAELVNGDFTLAIVIATMPVESFLTRMFLKLKHIEYYAVTFNLPAADVEEWEAEYPRGGGFSGPVEFVSKRVFGKTFDEFVGMNTAANDIFSKLPNNSNVLPTRYIQDQLFKRRNRIVHWGYVNSSEAEAKLCHDIAVATVSILRHMDRTKYAMP